VRQCPAGVPIFGKDLPTPATTAPAAAAPTSNTNTKRFGPS
jgi:hypothetical protein